MPGTAAAATAPPNLSASLRLIDLTPPAYTVVKLYSEEAMQPFPPTLGLDIGSRRIGIALSDALGLAQPLITMGRSNPKLELKNLGRIIRKHAVIAIVAGDPLLPSGDVGPQALKARAFAQAVADSFGMPVHLQAEALTSRAADDLLDRRGFPRGPARKAVLDQYAAVVILQDWIDAQSGPDGGLNGPDALHADGHHPGVPGDEPV
jgi:putative Holliday junction resolvase